MEIFYDSITVKTLTAIRLDFTDNFGGLKKTGGPSLMHADTYPNNWYYSVGIISDQYKPFFPGPRIFLNTTDIRLYIKKDC